MSGSFLQTSPLAILLNTSTQQSFRQGMVPNVQQALYALSIRAPGASALPFSTYTFPMSPQSVQKTFTSMSTVYDVPGSAAYNGVVRQVDIFGTSPVTYVLEGSTGWNRHSTDNFLYTGLQSIQTLQALLSEYAQLNQQLIQAGNSILYTLEFYDYFSQEFWQVEPIGPQWINQDASQPLYTKYKFVLAGIQHVSAPLISSSSDILGQLFTAAVGPAIASAQSAISGVLTSAEGSLSSALSSIL